jgi:hypothetical protein
LLQKQHLTWCNCKSIWQLIKLRCLQNSLNQRIFYFTIQSKSLKRCAPCSHRRCEDRTLSCNCDRSNGRTHETRCRNGGRKYHWWLFETSE